MTTETHGHGEGESHNAPYMLIFGVLLVLTLAEVGYAFLSLPKFWLALGREMQIKRSHDRRHDPLKIWKLSPIDLVALKRFDDYSRARDRMLEATDGAHAPWHVVLSNDKPRGRLAIIRTVLHALIYEGKDEGRIGEVDGKIAMRAEDFLAAKKDL